MSTIEVKVPDIGDFQDVPVIDVLVKPGDTVKAEDSLVTLESDKATMDVPSPSGGLVKELRIKVGDKVKEGTPILVLESDGSGLSPPSPQPSPASGRGSTGDAASSPSSPASARGGTPSSSPLPLAGEGSGVRAFAPPPESKPSAQEERAPRGEKGRADMPGEGAIATPPLGATVEVRVPDIGDFTDIPVIEIFVKPGDIVKVDDALVMLESDKATMDVPSPLAGAVQGVRVSVGDRVSEGTVIATIAPSAAVGAPSAAPAEAAVPTTATPPGKEEAAAQAQPAEAARAPSPLPAQAPGVRDEPAFKAAHASPSVRKFARELGVDLSRIEGSGPKGRILQEDVQRYVKQALAAPAPAAAGAPAGAVAVGGALNLLAWPKVDFAKFGEIETKPLSRIRKISGQNLARNWVMIPHVTQLDEADVTDLEALRVQLNKEHEKAGVKFTLLAFLIKASVAGLQKFPDFNASLDGENLVYKKYYNIGFAADTPNGLVVPVVKGADRKGLVAIAKEMAELSAKAREGKLGPADMQGGCFSISSLGGIGGTGFTPIVNAPEVAILGVSKGAMKPVWDGKTFAPRLMLPLSLSYDHRVIDGAAAARFTSYLAQILADFRRVVL
jgi:pyruvate dehydrogenase E2 component (dihydrolipoamide acetyltransferase)